ncbi:hypothetical protein [Nesterenkonia pannonica]|uniref:hypothetical protein n=1 Tax=Nesterenkonia pannonica TaxID=1548602 RepID=UPI002164E973|nr:hypothetical protein [Nesterenkonia pannonica]
MPTVLGVQEALPDQAEWVHAALGDSYGRVGYGRARDGGDEAAPIFYDAQRLELLDWGQHALSRKPGEPGSRSWGSMFPRVFVAASFRDRDTGMRFQMINTHLDHLSAWARLMSARALSAAVQACPTPRSSPAISIPVRRPPQCGISAKPRRCAMRGRCREPAQRGMGHILAISAASGPRQTH